MSEPILQFFAYSHLPGHLAEVARPFAQLAYQLCSTLPRNPERTVALRKLLEAKDSAVRARLYKDLAEVVTQDFQPTYQPEFPPVGDDKK